MTTRRAFLPPARPLPEDAIAALRAFLEHQRFGIVAAYHVDAVHPADESGDAMRQEELIFELRDPPELAAPAALFMVVGHEMPPLFPPIDIFNPRTDRRSLGFTFASRDLLETIRATAEPLWERDEAEPMPASVEVALVYEQPVLPDRLVAAVRSEILRCTDIEAAYFVTQRLLVDDVELSSRLQLLLEGDLRSEAWPVVADSLREILRGELENFSIATGSGIRCEASQWDPLVVYEAPE
jgi:hypothetical protein